MLFLNVDLRAILGVKNLDTVMEQAAKQAGQMLAPAAHAHLLEEANTHLNSRREKYIKALSIAQEGDTTWIIVLDRSANWIEGGVVKHEMINDLLKNAKTGKNGQKYATVPFDHSSGHGPTNSTPAQLDLISTIKAEMKKRKIPFSKTEKNEDGSPMLGNLHSFNINERPLKTHDGVGQGHGKIGDVKQGMTGLPFLHGVKVSQQMVKGDDGKTRVKKSIMTFRRVSSTQLGSGKWVHPGLEPFDGLQKTYDWALVQWEKEVLPKVTEYVMQHLEELGHS